MSARDELKIALTMREAAREALADARAASDREADQDHARHDGEPTPTAGRRGPADEPRLIVGAWSAHKVRRQILPVPG